MITLQKISLRRANKILLEETSLTIFAKQKIGLIGNNGCGKSSFFAMLQGELEVTHGIVQFPKDMQIVHVNQEIPTSTQSAIEYVIEGDKRYCSLQQILNSKNQDAATLAKCHDELASIDGYTIRGRAEKILKGLGFQDDQLQSRVIDFSGGWRMRLNLAQALISQSDLMLLDEPTNHLDIDAIIWLEKWLQEYSGTLLLISHDREFLDNTVTHILNFQKKQLQLYRGNYSAFEKAQAMEQHLQQATYEKQQIQVAHMQEFIDRFRAKATKARQAQSRLKALQRMQLVSAVESETRFKFVFKKNKACPNPLLNIEQALLGYDENNPILTNVNLQISPSDRIGLLGVNGAGKSTLIKSIAGLQQPLSGTIFYCKGIKIGYFAQHQIEHLDLELSPLQSLRDIAPHNSEQELRNHLGSFNFSGNMATEKITNLSGGEKARLALALIVWQEPNLLLLDEPTNHLDINMREALILALQEYEGALILVSHDRHLLRTTSDELILVSDKKIERFKGDLDDYREFLLQKNNNRMIEPTNSKDTQINTGKERRKLETKLNSIEKELSQLNQQKSQIDALLADVTLYEQNDTKQIKIYLEQQEELSKKITITEEAWIEILAQLENIHYRETNIN